MTAKLYYTPQSCGAASYIVAHKIGAIASGSVVAFETDIRKHVLVGDGSDFYAVNPKGNVPALVMDGVLLNENVAVLVAVGDLCKQHSVLPAEGALRYLVINKLAYVASEMHASVGGLFNPALSAEVRAYVLDRYKSKLAHIEKSEFATKKYMVGDSFTVADSYCYIVLSWSPYVGVSLDEYPNTKAYFERIQSLDFVKAAHAAMAEVSAKK